MLILTPDPKYTFHGRDGSPSDALVVRESWSENVYQIHAYDFADTGIMIDIGANIGSVAIKIASFNDEGREGLPPVTVLAIEPEPDNLRLLEENIKENNVAEYITTSQVAVDKIRGRGWMTDGHGHSQLLFEEIPRTTEVPIVTLADVFADNGIQCADVVKIDVEGGEYAIIEGAPIDVLQKIRYLAIEFDSAKDWLFGRMLAKLCKVFGVQVLGSPERGGYIYARRYDILPADKTIV